jgi:hypothetical protein
VYSERKIDSLTTHENVAFVDGDTPWEMSIPANPDSTYNLSNFSDAELGDFLSRPIKIASYTWTPLQAVLFETFNPWTLFFSNVDVLDKLRRYRNLRSHLRLKVLINGNPFYYGRALLSYNPYLVSDDVTISRAFFEADMVEQSQRPHILIDPTSSQGGEMFLPFIWPENYLDITTAGWASTMGECTLANFGMLRHANAGTDPITISIYAWTEGLSLSVPTTNTVASPQSGVSDRPLDDFGFPKPYYPQAQMKNKNTKKKGNNASSNDEFTHDGLISKPASAIAKAADMLSMIPILAPYAKATSMVATKVGQVAKIFGYSRPQIVSDSQVVVPRFMGNMCNTDSPENLIRLTADSKNELTIDSRVMGLSGQDELAISSIVSRPSYFRTFEWPEAKGPGDILFSVKVLPTLFRTIGAGETTEYHQTALSFGSLPFSMWQGSIKFRFIAVASEYHRGRLRIVYNPKSNSVGEIPFNQVYSTVIDIAEDRDFEYEVKWADIRAWNTCPSLTTYSSSDIYSVIAPVSGGGLDDNGTLSVYVVNELATPSTYDSPINVLVWVSAGDDFALSVPTDNKLALLSPFRKEQAQVAKMSISAKTELIDDSDQVSPLEDADYAPQSEMLATSTDDSNAPLETSMVTSFGTNIADNSQYLVYQGERIVSFRELLRRYYYHTSEFPNKFFPTRHTLVDMGQSDFPYYRGYDLNGQGNAPGNYKFTWCNNTLLNYLTPAYVMRRGGIRHKAIHSDKQSPTGTMSVYRAEQDSIGPAYWNTRDLTPNGAQIYDTNRQILASGITTCAGLHVTALPVNPALEYECGFYTRGQRFVAARRLDYWSGISASHRILVSSQAVNDITSQRIDKYISVAEDFTLALFIGAPVLYSYITPVQVP